MNRDEYLQKISDEAGFMPPAEKRRVMRHFRSLFGGAVSDADIIGSIGAPYDALKTYLDGEKTPAGTPEHKVLGITAMTLLSPVIISAAVTAACLVFIISVFALMLLLIASVGGVLMWLGGIDIVINTFFQQAILADKIIQTGFGLMISGAGTALMFLMYKFYSVIIPKLLEGASRLNDKFGKR